MITDMWICARCNLEFGVNRGETLAECPRCKTLLQPNDHTRTYTTTIYLAYCEDDETTKEAK